MQTIAQEPTPAEMLASVLRGSGTIKLVGVLRPVLVRLPEWQLVKVDAMAKIAGKSRSAMTVHLVDIALQEVERALAQETKDLIQELSSVRLVQLDADTSDRESGEVL